MKPLIIILFIIPFLGFKSDQKGPGEKINPADVDKDKVFILIDKSSYRLYVYEDVTLLKSYPVVFGNDDLGDKMMAGDRETPEGTFHIIAKRYDNRWSRFLLLDYPTPASEQKFEERKAEHLIPENAQIGGGIGIHGTWPKDDFVFIYRQNWTNGCISMHNADVDELYNLVKVGTPVVIRY
jgi:lipoprotein-anchoring transpeptidase ErfK/SrfK